MPTPQQRAAFEERLDLEVKRIQKQKRQNSQIPELTSDRQDLYQDFHQDPQRSREVQDAQTISESQDSTEIPPVQYSNGPQTPQRVADHRSKRRRFLRRVGSMVAVLVLFVFMTMYHTVEAFAAGVDRFIATMVPEDGAEELRIEEKEGAQIEFNREDYVGMYFPEWIPRGYSTFGIEQYLHTIKIVYSNNAHDIITYEVSRTSNSVFLDDEIVVESSIYVLDTWAKVIDTDEMSYVVWEDAEHIYTVSGKLDMREALIKMVEKSIKIEQEN